LSFGFIFQRTGDKGTTLRLFIAAVADGEMALQAPWASAQGDDR